MYRYVAVATAIKGSQSIDSSLLNFLEKARNLNDGYESHSSGFKLIVTDADFQEVKTTYPSKKEWANLSEFDERVRSVDEDGVINGWSASTEESSLADELHDLADSIPYTGTSLRVILFDNTPASACGEEPDLLVPLAGAVRRLREWHNAAVTLIHNEPVLHSSREILSDFGLCSVLDGVDKLKLDEWNWEGKVAVMDSIEGKGHLFSGHAISFDHWNEMLRDKLKTCNQAGSLKAVSLGRKRPRQPPVKTTLKSQPVCGRTIEVLQEVDLRTFPFVLVDSWTLNLKIQSCHSDVFISYINSLKLRGLLARLRVYPDKADIPSCGRTNTLSTAAWKRSVLGSSCQEPPEKSMADNVFFMYFLLLPPAGSSNDSQQDTADSVVALVLLSPRELNKDVIHSLQEQDLYKGDVPRLDMSDIDMDLRVLHQSEAFEKLLWLLAEHRKNVVKEITEQTSGLNCAEAKKVKEDILGVASEVEDKILALAFQEYPLFKDHIQQEHQSETVHWFPETALDPAEYPEKMALRAKVTKRAELESYPSTDSVLDSSHIALKELQKKKDSNDFDVDDILRMFNKNGTPIAPPFTPEKLEGRNLCRVDSTPDLGTPWPNCQSLQFHDIYYYIDENDLGLERKYAKIRDREIGQDTLSTFVSPLKKKRTVRKISPVRSSPRRSNSAQSLMIRSRSDSVSSTSSAGEVFKQPSKPSLLSPTSRRASLFQSTPGSVALSSSTSKNVSAEQRGAGSRSNPGPRGLPTPTGKSSKLSGSQSGQLHKWSSPKFQSTPVATQPLRKSPRKRVLTKSLSSVHIREIGPAHSSSPSPVVSTSRDKGHRADTRHDRPASSSSSRRVEMSISSSGSAGPSRLSPTSINKNQPTWRSPRKAAKMAALSSPIHSVKQASLTQSCTELRPSPVTGLDEGPCLSQSGGETNTKMKRSERHKMKLRSMIKNILQEKGVKESDSIYSACFKNLYNVSMVLLKTLTTSQNLTEEMKNVVYSQVQQIINLEKRRCGISL